MHKKSYRVAAEDVGVLLELLVQRQLHALVQVVDLRGRYNGVGVGFEWVGETRGSEANKHHQSPYHTNRP